MSDFKDRLDGGFGTHVIADFFDCVNLDNDEIKETLIEAANISGATVLHSKFHEFTPQGLTGYLLLAESHISIHTWPEHRYAAVDVFTCGETMDPMKAVEYLKGKLEAGNVETSSITRGARATGKVAISLNSASIPRVRSGVEQ